MADAAEPVDARCLSFGGVAVRLGVGALDSVGADARSMRLERVLLVSDGPVRETGVVERVAGSLASEGIWSETLLAPPGEPTDRSILAMVAAARASAFDGVVAVGGGSVLDAAKAICLLLGEDGLLLDYVNPPFGAGRAPRRPSMPLIAVPTTAGSGSDVSSVAVLEIEEAGVKTAISHPALRPALTIADPVATLGLPPAATAAAGLDSLSHALESLTARPADRRPRAHGAAESVYAGANPYSDALCERALPLLARGLPRAVARGEDLDARSEVMIAATLANVGAATAGAHAGHACAYAVAARVEEVGGSPPAHGIAVSLLMPALMERLFDADQERHARIARRLEEGGLVAGAPARERVAELVKALLRACNAPAGLAALGLGPDDVAPMVRQALRQERLMAGAPEGWGEEQLDAVLRSALEVLDAPAVG